jgi:hypothetical protein
LEIHALHLALIANNQLPSGQRQRPPDFLAPKQRAHLAVGGDFAGLPKPFKARSCECTQHDVFKGVWSRTKMFFGCESGWAFIPNGAVNGWHANSACNGNVTTDVGG